MIFEPRQILCRAIICFLHYKSRHRKRRYCTPA
jgi:hypothetical protein